MALGKVGEIINPSIRLSRGGRSRRLEKKKKKRRETPGSSEPSSFLFSAFSMIYSWTPPPLPSWNSPRRCAFRAKILGPFFHSLSTRRRGAERERERENGLFISRTRIAHLASTGFPLPWNSRVVSVSITRGGYLSVVSSLIYLRFYR